MKWFDTYSSNTLAGSGNQYYFKPMDKEVHRGRIYYRIFAEGTYKYSLLFSNIIDSTFADGKVSHCNLICPAWDMVQVRAGVCSTCDAVKAAEPRNFQTVTFGGRENKHVMPGEFFVSDPVMLSAGKGEYLCLEIAFCGEMIPYHEESILPVFVWENGEWIVSKHVPVPGMIGCDRPVKKRVAFLGDSITQGCGTPVNAYMHWNARVADLVGDGYGYWNLGLGWGRAQDAASDGAWLYKAKQCDAAVVCYGTNDLGQGRSLEQIQADLLTIVTKLQAAGVKVLLQTVPPFDWEGEQLEKWCLINTYIREFLAKRADGVFDVVPFLINGPEKYGKTRYCSHPNEAGCAAWAAALAPVLKDFLNRESCCKKRFSDKESDSL